MSFVNGFSGGVSFVNSLSIDLSIDLIYKFFTSGSSWHHKYILTPVDYFIASFFQIFQIYPSKNGVPIKLFMLPFCFLEFVIIVFIWYVVAVRGEIFSFSLAASIQMLKKSTVSMKTSSANVIFISLVVLCV